MLTISFMVLMEGVSYCNANLVYILVWFYLHIIVCIFKTLHAGNHQRGPRLPLLHGVSIIHCDQINFFLIFYVCTCKFMGFVNLLIL